MCLYIVEPSCSLVLLMALQARLPLPVMQRPRRLRRRPQRFLQEDWLSGMDGVLLECGTWVRKGTFCESYFGSCNVLNTCIDDNPYCIWIYGVDQLHKYPKYYNFQNVIKIKLQSTPSITLQGLSRPCHSTNPPGGTAVVASAAAAGAAWSAGAIGPVTPSITLMNTTVQQCINTSSDNHVSAYKQSYASICI